MFSKGKQCIAAIAKRFGAAGINGESAVIGGYGLIQPAEREEDRALIVQHAGVVAAQLKRAIVGRQRFLVAIELAQRIAEIVVSGGVGRIDFDRAADQLDCGVVVAELGFNNAQEMQRTRIVGVGKEGLAVKPRCFLEPAYFVQFNGLLQQFWGIHGRRTLALGHRLPVIARCHASHERKRALYHNHNVRPAAIRAI